MLEGRRTRDDVPPDVVELFEEYQLAKLFHWDLDQIAEAPHMKVEWFLAFARTEVDVARKKRREAEEEAAAAARRGRSR